MFANYFEEFFTHDAAVDLVTYFHQGDSSPLVRVGGVTFLVQELPGIFEISLSQLGRTRMF